MSADENLYLQCKVCKDILRIGYGWNGGWFAVHVPDFQDYLDHFLSHHRNCQLYMDTFAYPPFGCTTETEIDNQKNEKTISYKKADLKMKKLSDGLLKIRKQMSDNQDGFSDLFQKHFFEIFSYYQCVEKQWQTMLRLKGKNNE